MSAKKFEKLIDLIINEDQERANQLFHEIVVEKSREIYESIIEEDSIEGLEDEVSADDEGSMDDLEGEEDFGDEDFGDEEGETDLGDEEFGDEGDEEGDLEDRVVDLEDKLDELMAEFEAQMGGGDEEEFGDEEGEEDFGDEEEFGDGEGEEDFGDDEEGLMEAAQMNQIGGKTYDKFGKMGNDGEQTKSAGLQNPKRVGNGGAPVQFSGKSEAAPKTAKKPSNYAAKGEKQEDFGNVNVPGGNAGKTAFKKKIATPKVEKVKADSILPESKTTTKRRI